MTGLAARLARPEILALPRMDIAASATGFGPDAIKLDANENPHPPLASGPFSEALNRYPEPQPRQLVEAMAALYSVKPEALVATRGADDAIDILVRAFCRPGEDAVAILEPTFSAYGHFARLQGARIVTAKLDENFDLQLGTLLEQLRREAKLKLVFLCSPNNPTGNLIKREDVLALAAALPETIIVLDEAYIEFCDTASLAADAERLPNLAVLRTLSKAYGLAGARIGALIAHSELAAIARKALPPYPLPSLSIHAALHALAPSRRLIHDARIRETIAERARVATALAASPVVRSVRNGGGNFLFLEVEEPEALAAKLKSLGIRTRFRPNAAPGGLRLTIGTAEENDVALAALEVEATAKPRRTASLTRDTKETRIAIQVDLDRAEPRRIVTGLGFFDHMLDQVAGHGGFSLVLACEGDLHIDAHHSIEDVAIALGQALSKALGERRGINRFGFALPMDESSAEVLIDLSGRPYAKFEGSFDVPEVGGYPTQMTSHVFRSLAEGMGAAIHVRVAGENDHHKTEACYKAFGRALRQAIAAGGNGIPSTKGVL